MSYFRKLDSKLDQLLELLNKKQRWLIMCVADPDAMASAMALKKNISEESGKCWYCNGK